MTEPTRATLLLRLRVDGPAREVAWDEFYELYAPIITTFARRFGASAADADDTLQDVMKAILSANGSFSYDPAKGRFRNYLKTCVCRKIVERRRKQGDRRAASLESIGEDDAVAVEATWNDIWETQKLHRALANVRVRYAVNEDRQKTFRAFELCNVLGRDVGEAALELSLSAESVRAAKSRVSRAVREEFDQLTDEFGVPRTTG